MEVTALLRAFCEAVERRDGRGFASLFSEDGVYHDAFYGAFAGRAKIAGTDQRLKSSSAENSLIAWSNFKRWPKIDDNSFGATKAKKKGPGDAPLGQCKGRY